MMHQNYCFKCGCFTVIDQATKLCTSCYMQWAGASKSPASTTL